MASVHQQLTLTNLTIGLLTIMTWLCSHVCPWQVLLYDCAVHTLVYSRTGAHTDVWGLLLSWRAEASGELSPGPPLPRPSFLGLFTPFRSCSWFDLRQNSIPHFHTLSAVDKGPAHCSWASREGTMWQQNGTKSNSSRQWGPFVELSQMKAHI